MKKILTKKQKGEKSKRNQLVLGLLLISLMMLSTLGYALRGDKEEIEKIEYKGIEFIKDDSGYWIFNIQDYDFITKYNPQEVENINFFNTLTLQNYYNKPLYFVGDYPEPFSELLGNLNSFVLRFNEACIDNNCSKTKDLPIKNCSEDNLIIIQEIDYEDKTKETISQKENCVFITTSLGNQTKYADAFLYNLLGIG